jgi:hypothetical protein
MKFNVSYFGVFQEVELKWLSGIASFFELARITSLEVGESVTLRHGNMGGSEVKELFHVTRVA